MQADDLLPATPTLAGRIPTDGLATPESQIYRVGTLVYTRRGLVIIFFWMLFGDFSFTLMQGVVPTLMPLMLKDLSISNSTIGLVAGTIPHLINMVVVPVLSYRSDRHRGPWGRRIPYLVWFTPVVTACVILTGYSIDIGSWLHQALSSTSVSLSKPQVIFGTIAICSIAFEFFNLFVYYIYYYLFNDVIPEQFMGRFYALFRMVGAAAGFVFNRYVLGMAETHLRHIFVTIGLIYLVSFLVMCWRVKEGIYPPPPNDVKKRPWFSGLRTFIRECYTTPFYWRFYLAYSLFVVGSSGIALFRIFFAKDLGMTLNEIGQILSWGAVLGVALSYPLGWLADRIHPMRLNVIAVVFTLAVLLGSALGIHSKGSFFLWTILGYFAGMIAVAANGPLFPAILPKTRFGQFTSAVSLVQSGAVMVANYVVGMLVDKTGSYRVIYWWGVFFTAASLVFTLWLYRGWQRRGGRANYVAPLG